MAQFDLHRNLGRHKEAIPFVVIVQSSQFKDYRRQVVVPLVRASAIGSVRFPAFNLTFVIKGAKVVLHPLEIVSVPSNQLGAKVGSLIDAGQQIIDALDELFCRAWK
jgi:toxin CcdB